MKEVPLSVGVEKRPEGLFVATSKDPPGLVVQADSIAQALDIAQDAAQKLMESYREPCPPEEDQRKRASDGDSKKGHMRRSEGRGRLTPAQLTCWRARPARDRGAPPPHQILRCGSG